MPLKTKQVRMSFILLATSIFVLLICLSMASGKAGRWFTKEGGNSAPSKLVTAQASSNSQASRDRLEVELITITPRGFEPAEITRPAGKFLLEIDNRSGIEQMELHLDREHSRREKSVTVRRTAPEWRGTLDLEPGVYVLSEANHPKWTCRITLTSH